MQCASLERPLVDENGEFVTKHQQSEADFNASLAERLRATTRTAAPMHMNDLPSGPSKSLADLLNDNQEQGNQSSRNELPSLSVDAESDGMATRRVPLHLIVDSPYQPRKLSLIHI